MRLSVACLVSLLTLLGPRVGAGAENGELTTPEPGRAAMGRATYRAYCGSCHGKEGLGDGTVAKHLDPRPADLTQIAQRRGGEFPAQELREIIDGRTLVSGHGDRDMPVWGDSFQIADPEADEEAIRGRIDNLVHYLLSIQVEEAPGEP